MSTTKVMCPRCGVPIAPSAAFCPECRGPIPEQAAEAQDESTRGGLLIVGGLILGVVVLFVLDLLGVFG